MIKKFLPLVPLVAALLGLVLVADPVAALVAPLLMDHQGTAVTVGAPVAAAMQALLGVSSPGKFLYRTSEAKAAIGCGTTKLYALINSGVLEARRFGRRTYSRPPRWRRSSPLCRAW
jgi:hypothetical protein